MPTPIASTNNADAVKPGDPQQRPHGVAHILLKPFDPGPSPRLASIFAQPECIAKVFAALSRHHLAVKVHIVLELPVELTTIKEILKTAK